MNKSNSGDIIEKVEQHLLQTFPGVKNRKMILGASGGPDSMSLMYIFSRLDVDLLVVHCNYNMRGESSDRDQELVEETAAMWGYETVTASLDPGDRVKENFQNWARIRRYKIFRDLKDENDLLAIATAHHQDDQLETIIQKILRGAGMTAWQGMKIWNGELFRPMLDFSKADILHFASRNHVPYRHDSSNEESTYARNFLRNGWFPILDDLFPGWRENLLKVPDRAREHEALSKSLIRAICTDERSLDRSRLLSLPQEVQKPLLLQVFKSTDPQMQVSTGALDNLEKLESIQTGKKIIINPDWSLIRDRDHFQLIRESEKSVPSLRIIEELELDDGNSIEVGPEIYIQKNRWKKKIDTRVLQLDAGVLKWPLTIRTWEEGDEINPFGMEGTQKVSDLLTNRKIEASLKRQALILESFDNKISAVIFPPGTNNELPGTIAEWAKCQSQTVDVITIDSR